MAFKVPSTSYFPTSKRSSCDRCRKQKLACPPRESTLHPCSRCIRARTECVTGYTRPLGPSANARAGVGPSTISSHVDSSTRSPGDNTNTGASDKLLWLMTPEVLGEEGSSAESTMEGLDLMGSLWMDLASEGNANGSSARWSPALETHPYDLRHTPPDSESLWPLSTFSGDDFLAAFSIASDAGLGLSHHSPPRPYHSGGTNMGDSPNAPTSSRSHGPGCHTPDVTMLDQTDWPSNTTPITHGFNGFTNPAERTANWSAAECDVRLSELNMRLSRQVVQLDISRASRTQNNTNAVSGNEFGNALCGTSEFLLILEHISRNHHRKVDEPPLETTAETAPPSCISLAAALNLTSVFLRLVTIFDGLLARLLQQSHQYLTVSSSFPSPYVDLANIGDLVSTGSIQTFPGLQLAGFPVQQRSLQIKLLVETVVHQFEMIEKILGLPVELRVSDRRDGYSTGLLSALGSLFGASLMDLVTPQVNSVGSPSAAAPLPYPPGSLASLRDSLSKLRRFVETSI